MIRELLAMISSGLPSVTLVLIVFFSFAALWLAQAARVAVLRTRDIDQPDDNPSFAYVAVLMVFFLAGSGLAFAGMLHSTEKEARYALRYSRAYGHEDWLIDELKRTGLDDAEVPRRWQIALAWNNYLNRLDTQSGGLIQQLQGVETNAMARNHREIPVFFPLVMRIIERRSYEDIDAPVIAQRIVHGGRTAIGESLQRHVQGG